MYKVKEGSKNLTQVRFANYWAKHLVIGKLFVTIDPMPLRRRSIAFCLMCIGVESNTHLILKRREVRSKNSKICLSVHP